MFFYEQNVLMFSKIQWVICATFDISEHAYRKMICCFEYEYMSNDMKNGENERDQC